MKTLWITLSLVLISSSAFAASANKSEAITTDRDEVDAVCAKDGVNAKCPKTDIGKDLASCIRAYRSNHAEYVLSSDCEKAMNQARADTKKARKK